MNFLEVYVLLQILDALTTLVGVRLGIGEANPFIRHVMGLSPATGLMISKSLGLAFGGLCLVRHQEKVIHTMNYILAGVVMWNLGQILMHA